MFDRIAPHYEAMNTLMTLGMDRGWRRRAVRASGLRPGGSAVDVACGTGSLTRELARAVPSGAVTGIDISPTMLAEARRRTPRHRSARVRYVMADALELPMPDASVDAVTIGFGLRNMPDYRRCLWEMARVVRRGGRVVVLEISRPRSRVARLLAVMWFRRVVPLIGRLAGNGEAYRYLPDSVRDYPEPEAVRDLMEEVGLTDVRWRRLGLGLVTLHVGRKA